MKVTVASLSVMEHQGASVGDALVLEDFSELNTSMESLDAVCDVLEQIKAGPMNLGLALEAHDQAPDHFILDTFRSGASAEAKQSIALEGLGEKMWEGFLKMLQHLREMLTKLIAKITGWFGFGKDSSKEKLKAVQQRSAQLKAHAEAQNHPNEAAFAGTASFQKGFTNLELRIANDDPELKAFCKELGSFLHWVGGFISADVEVKITNLKQIIYKSVRDDSEYEDLKYNPFTEANAGVEAQGREKDLARVKEFNDRYNKLSDATKYNRANISAKKIVDIDAKHGFAAFTFTSSEIYKIAESMEKVAKTSKLLEDAVRKAIKSHGSGSSATLADARRQLTELSQYLPSVQVAATIAHQINQWVFNVVTRSQEHVEKVIASEHSAKKA